jgi:hypothetical protein
MRQTGRSCAYFVEKSAKARVLAALESLEEHTVDLLKVHKIENFFDSDFGICVIS